MQKVTQEVGAVDTPVAESFESSLRMLLVEVRAVAGAWNGKNGGSVWLHRVAVPVPAVDPIALLAGCTLSDKVYWSGREDGEVVAAVGSAHDCTDHTASCLRMLRHQLERQTSTSAPGIRYFGGVRFDTKAETAPEWRSFGAFRFILPRFELAVRGGEATLACNLVLPADAARVDQICEDALKLSGSYNGADRTLPVPVSRIDLPSRERWDANVEWALRRFDSSELEKIVLARRVSFDLERRPDPFLLLDQLRQVTPGCFHFCFQPDDTVAFLGASPERLYRREGRAIWSEAVAGTRPRGRSETDDRRLRDELLLSEKDQREHRYVRLSIMDSLRPFCEALQIDDTASEMMLTRGRHLYSAVNGTLREDATDYDVLTSLSPTPAVGGYPTEDALKELRTLEAFGRGWYAGSVGWIGTERAEFAVAIRSGLVRDRNLMLYSGAGIVAGSKPADEWVETEQKIADFAGILHLDQDPS